MSSLKKMTYDEIELNDHQNHNHNHYETGCSDRVELIGGESCLEKNLVVIKQEQIQDEKEDKEHNLKEKLNNSYDLNNCLDTKARVNFSSRESNSQTNFIDVAQSFSLSSE